MSIYLCFYVTEDKRVQLSFDGGVQLNLYCNSIFMKNFNNGIFLKIDMKYGFCLILFMCVCVGFYLDYKEKACCRRKKNK